MPSNLIFTQCDYSVTGNSTLLNVSRTWNALLLRCTRKRAHFPARVTIQIEPVIRDCLRFFTSLLLHFRAALMQSFGFCVSAFALRTSARNCGLDKAHTVLAKAHRMSWALFTRMTSKRPVTLHGLCEQLVPAELTRELLVYVPLNYATCIIIKSWVNWLVLGKRFRKRHLQSCKGTQCEQRLVRVFGDEVKASACSSRMHAANFLETQVRNGSEDWK